MSTDPLSPAAHTVERYIAFFNTLDTQQDLNAITTLTHVDIRFQDPFNDVIGHTALIKVLEHFRNTIKKPRFTVKALAWQGSVCLVRWDFSGQFNNGKVWEFPGVSELHLTSEGQIIQHIDHWDAATYFYAKLPLIGSLIRLIRRRIAC